jgi:hypothetical protein
MLNKLCVHRLFAWLFVPAMFSLQMAFQQAAARETDKSLTLGRLSAKYESGSRGPEMVSTGKGDPGGVSYGTYQLASALGNADRFVQKHFASIFKGLKGGTPEFTEVWKKTVAKNPQAFHRKEHEYIKETHYDPQVKLIEKELGITLDKRSAALRDVVWSCAVHHGPNSKLILTAAKNLPPTTDLKSPKSDIDLIKAIYAERGRIDNQGKLVYFQRVADSIKPSLTNRFQNELADALKMLSTR